MTRPWFNDSEMRIALEAAGWRYAILIGITGAPEQIERYKQDKVTYSHLIKKHTDGTAIWNDVEAAKFVQELTGYPLNVCDQWLKYDWPG